jgi:pSer/pThr/pTyr-binding forkhead associated (FHA) protein
MNKSNISHSKVKRRVFKLKDGSIYIGRFPDNDIKISDRYVSGKHLQLRKRGNKIFIRDLESTNGTFINGEQIKPHTETLVKEGSTIIIGTSVICLGEQSWEDVLALLDSIYSSEEFNDTTMVTLKLE